MNKIMVETEAIQKVKSNQTLMVGGFGLVGAPLTLIEELTHLNVKDLTVISNNLGEPGKGLGTLLRQGKVKKAIGSYFTSNREVGNAYNEGRIDVQLMPQGSFAESIRAGGAGIGGYYTRTGVDTQLGDEDQVKEINGERYLFQPALKADVALVKAYKCDSHGNLTYYKTGRNFNPIMATAAKIVIAEVDEIVESGELSPEEIITPHLFVDIIVKSKKILTKKGVAVR